MSKITTPLFSKSMFNSHYTDKYSYFSRYKSSVWYYNGCYLGEHPFIVAQNEGHFYPHLYFFVIVPKVHYYFKYLDKLDTRPIEDSDIPSALLTQWSLNFFQSIPTILDSSCAGLPCRRSPWSPGGPLSYSDDFSCN